jgi:RNA polymerase sigma-70 factor, ECF subfamily
MPELAEKLQKQIDEAAARLIARAADPRGLTASDVAPRIALAAEKYLFTGSANAASADIRSFASEIRADDLCLVIACERGDEKAWEDLVANFDGTVRSAARKITRGGEEAEDLASSIWAELYGLRQDEAGRRKTKLAYYSGRGSLAGWLRAVVSQLAIDEFRKQTRFVQIEEDRELDALAGEASSENADREPVFQHANDPETILSEKLTAEDVGAALRSAVEELDAEDRLVMKLYYFDDLKLKEIGRMFGYHEATASRKLVRIQNEIRKAVERKLRSENGWSETEVRRHLSDAAAKLGISLERLFTALLLICMQVWRH